MQILFVQNYYNSDYCYLFFSNFNILFHVFPTLGNGRLLCCAYECIHPLKTFNEDVSGSLITEMLLSNDGDYVSVAVQSKYMYYKQLHNSTLVLLFEFLVPLQVSQVYGSDI